MALFLPAAILTLDGFSRGAKEYDHLSLREPYGSYASVLQILLSVCFESFGAKDQHSFQRRDCGTSAPVYSLIVNLTRYHNLVQSPRTAGKSTSRKFQCMLRLSKPRAAMVSGENGEEAMWFHGVLF